MSKILREEVFQLDDEKDRVLYSSDGAGRWWKRAWKAQCASEIIVWGRCQGTKGHDDKHWCYTPDGSYAWAAPKKGGGGLIPPENEGWVSPATMTKLYHSRFFEDAEITDAALLAKLEAGEEIDGMVDRPCSVEEIAELRAMGRLDDLEDE